MSWGGVDKEDVKIDQRTKVDDSVKKMAETHKMSPDTVKAAGLEGSQRPPGSGRRPGDVLHQRGRVPFSYTTMTVAGLVITGVIAYAVLYSKKKHEADAADVAKATLNTAPAEQNLPRK